MDPEQQTTNPSDKNIPSEAEGGSAKNGSVSSSADRPIVSDHRRPRDGFRGIFNTFLLILAALAVAFILTAFVFQQYEVDGPSMETTLMNQDRLIVVKLPKTWSDITGHPYIPVRGSIIVFNEAGLYNADGIPEKQLIKRVIALPGERLVIQNGVVTIYNKQHPNGFDPDKTLGYFKGKAIPYTNDTVNMIIPKGDVFVMGDNRTDSLDSRYFGPVPVKNIIGKLDMRIYPFNTIRVF